MTIVKDQWYSISDLVNFSKQGLLPVKSPSTWLKAIKEGKLKAFAKDPDGIRKRYSIQGKDILEFIEKNQNAANNLSQ